MTSVSAAAATCEVAVVMDGKPAATIVIAETPTPAANLAALELQYHVEKMTGAVLPIVTDTETVEGARFLVGESEATRALGLKGEDFAPQEYLIRFLPDTVVLMGRDWQDTPENRAEAGRGTNWPMALDAWRQDVDYNAAVGRDSGQTKTITLPGIFDDQATCYATYDFLERFCDVRWYGPTELNMVYAQTANLTVTGDEVRRAPDMEYREGM
ncbi:MAG: hypothetical protein GY851_33885, partial [bacterium]|nr:hypothetical protein [bacterium]